MLKTLKLPSAEEFEASLDEAQKWAAFVGYDEIDVNDIIKSVRKKKKMWNLIYIVKTVYFLYNWNITEVM